MGNIRAKAAYKHDLGKEKVENREVK